MARSIVLRFDATCFDCGASLSAGTTARWFGRGRVSCCGGQAPAAPRSLPPAAPAPARVVSLPPLGVASPNGAAAAPSPSASARVPHSAIPPYLPSPELARLAQDTGVPVENLSAGLTPDHVTTLASKTPNQRLLVRLQSGARFIVPALHALHVLRCIGESCIDRVRDVALLADKGSADTASYG